MTAMKSPCWNNAAQRGRSQFCQRRPVIALPDHPFAPSRQTESHSAAPGNHAPVFPVWPRAGLHELAWLWRWRCSTRPCPPWRAWPDTAVNARKRLLRATSWTSRQHGPTVVFPHHWQRGAVHQPLLDWMREAGNGSKTWTQTQRAGRTRSRLRPAAQRSVAAPCRVRQLPAVAGKCCARHAGAGVQFVFNAQVTRLVEPAHGNWEWRARHAPFDAVVVCAGAARTPLRPRGILAAHGPGVWPTL